MSSRQDDDVIERRRAQNRLAQRKLRQRRAKLEQQQLQKQQQEEARSDPQPQDGDTLALQNLLANGCSRCGTHESVPPTTQSSQVAKEAEQKDQSQNVIDHILTSEELRDRCAPRNKDLEHRNCSIAPKKLAVSCEPIASTEYCEELHDANVQPNIFDDILWNTDVDFGDQETSYPLRKDSERARVPLTPPASVEAKPRQYNITTKGSVSMLEGPAAIAKASTRHPATESGSDPDQTSCRRTSTGSTKGATTDTQSFSNVKVPLTSANRGKMVLHLCAERGNTSMVQFLLEYGAEIDTTDGSGRTALHYAVQNSHLATVAKLLERGADTEILDCQGQTPLHVAAESGCAEVFCLLVQEGADPNTRIEMSIGDAGLATRYNAETMV